MHVWCNGSTCKHCVLNYSLNVTKLKTIKFFSRCHSKKTFSPAELYQLKMESFPQVPEKEVKFLGDVTTNGFSWPGDAVGQAPQADKETGLCLDLRFLIYT